MKRGLKCVECGNVIFSYNRHDYKECFCGECFVDGGSDYFRYGAKDRGMFVFVEFDIREQICPLYYCEVFDILCYLKEGVFFAITSSGDKPLVSERSHIEIAILLDFCLVDGYYRPNMQYFYSKS